MKFGAGAGKDPCAKVKGLLTDVINRLQAEASREANQHLTSKTRRRSPQRRWNDHLFEQSLEDEGKFPTKSLAESHGPESHGQLTTDTMHHHLKTKSMIARFTIGFAVRCTTPSSDWTLFLRRSRR